ncbi:ABC-type nitrate/sulfonate/bicarbonate transport system permease component [Actinocorallia herbida]|uniref:ABC-type nitrate/sulfonate/bicarbonate transport system permease component n=1 Tax=Actinocorallia herbida TaxID=58109 RepID=A0A3N1CY12_9ACTN|nr:ABC transporter permease subunit [Actinocorallia herbida]ROO86161.1 ABC-type nitrate/sulfonate/bicarbonate transport system permease component [Actinocorallia herbida]
MRRLLSYLLPVGVTAAVVALWWVLSDSSTSLFFPPLRQILTSFQANWLTADFVDIVVPSLWRVGLGMVIGTLLGVVVGAAVGSVRRLEPYVQPQLEFMRALPPILVIPPMILILGTGDAMKIGVIAASAVWPILLATVDGVRSVEPLRDDMSRVFGLPWRARFRFVILPTATPHIWSGVRAATPIAFVVMVASEYYSSINGIGNFISQTSTSFRLADMWSAVVLLGLIGVVVNSLVAFGGRLLDRKFGEYVND